VLELRALLRRISNAGKPLRRAQDIWASEPEEAAVAVACGDCYGALRGPDDCCNTCGDVLSRYAERGWGIDPQSVGQCREGGGRPGDPVCGDAPGAGVPRAVICANHLDCGACVASGCGWCISQRACRPDEPWLCQGDVDHIGLGGVGKHTQCPSQESLDAERAGRRARVAKEEARQREASAREKAKHGGGGGSGGSGEYFLGRAMRKDFSASGGGVHAGKVTGFNEPYWVVTYEDGDTEELEGKELAALLVGGAEASAAEASEALTALKTEAEAAELAASEARAVFGDAVRGGGHSVGRLEELEAFAQRLDAAATAAAKRRDTVASELRAKGVGGTGEGKGRSAGGSDSSSGKAGKLRELERRARLAEEGYARSHPYETLGLLGGSGGGGDGDDEDGEGRTAASVTQGQIRSAYRRLSLKLHPDKALGLSHPDARVWADRAFADLVRPGSESTRPPPPPPPPPPDKQ